MRVGNPPNELWRLLSERHWDAAVSMLASSKTFRQQASTKLSTSKGSVSLYPLHYCLLESAPERLIIAVLNAYKLAVKHHYNHDLPLHLAIKKKRGVEIIKTLVDAYPDSIDLRCNGMDLLKLSCIHYSRSVSHEQDALTYIQLQTTKATVTATAPVVAGSSSGSGGKIMGTDVYVPSILNQGGLAVAATATPRISSGSNHADGVLNIHDQTQIIIAASYMSELRMNQVTILQNQASIKTMLRDMSQTLEVMNGRHEVERVSLQEDLNALRKEMQSDIEDLESKIASLQVGPDEINNDGIHFDQFTTGEVESFVELE